MLGQLQRELARRQRLAVEDHPLHTVALDATLDPHEDLGVDGLRAGVAAPQAATDRSEEEQRDGGDDQQRREEDDVLRPQHQAEEVEAARAEVEQHRLALVPHQPRQAVEHDLRRPDRGPAPLLEPGEAVADPRTRVDLDPPGVQGLDRFGLLRRRHGLLHPPALVDRVHPVTAPPGAAHLPAPPRPPVTSSPAAATRRPGPAATASTRKPPPGASPRRRANPSRTASRRPGPW